MQSHAPVSIPTPQTRTVRRTFINVAAALFIVLAGPPAHSTLPPVPQGVAVLNTIGDKGLRDGILSNSNVAMISIYDQWADMQPDAATFDFEYLDDTIATITNPAYPEKSILLRLKTMGGSKTKLGDTPDWVFEKMNVDPGSTVATPGVTYSFDDGGTTRCIPVFWDPVFLAKKKTLIAMAGAHFAGNLAIKIVGISFANALTDDWNIPHDTEVSPSEVELWLNSPTHDPPGAGYTTQKMIDAAIHHADATFTDGVIGSRGTTLSSASAVFTQADVGHSVRGRGYHSGTVISTWVSPALVTLNQRTGRTASTFTIVGRADGLIDVAMAAFPNQYISGAESGNGPDLDAGCASEGKDPGICLAETVNALAQMYYPGRYIVQRNNVSAIIPSKDEASDAWILLIEAAAAQMPVAGQALGVCWSNSDTPGYRMNGGTNCDQDNPDCPKDGECTGDCALSFGKILLRSAGRIESYCPKYYEIYPPDASNLQDEVATIHDDLQNLSCDEMSHRQSGH